MSCDDCCTSAETTTTRADGIELAKLRQDVEAVHAFHDEVEDDQIGFVDRIPLESGHSVFGLDHLETRGLEHRAHTPSCQPGVVDEQQLMCHTCSRIASAIRSRPTV